MKIGDYVVAVPEVPTSDPAWDIGIVKASCYRGKVTVWWLIADDVCPEYVDESIRLATMAEYNYAREEKGIDR